MLSAVAEGERQLDVHLAQLQRADLVHEKTRKPELEYIFKHSLTQESAYSSLLNERRAEYHRRVGEAIEKLFGDRVEEFDGLLAYHFERAQVDERAIYYLTRAGTRANRQAANVEAIAYFSKALELLRRQPETPVRAQQELELQTALGLPLMAMNGYGAPEVEHGVARALELCQQVGATPPFPSCGALGIFTNSAAICQSGANSLSNYILSDKIVGTHARFWKHTGYSATRSSGSVNLIKRKHIVRQELLFMTLLGVTPIPS